MSLRARLVAGLLLVASAGLLALGGVTYAGQRAFLLERADDQARGAIGVVGARLSGGDPFGAFGTAGRAGDGERSPAERGPGEPGGIPGAGFGPVPAPGGGADGDRDDPDRDDGGPDGGPPGDGAGTGLPIGLYGEQRAGDGRVLRRTALSLSGRRELAPPALPAGLRAGDEVTVDARDGSLAYRVHVARTPRAVPAPAGGGVTIAAVPLVDVEEALDRLLLVEVLVGAAVLAVLAALSWLLVGIGLRPLERIGRTADGIAAGDLAARVRVDRPGDEVGRVGTAMNAMLGRLERAFAAQRGSEERLRRFLADAAHELRTPLASIRGYSELFRIGAVSGPEETGRAMARIEGESARMGVLVEDLLTLARLDEEPELARRPVDLADVTGDVVADARATAPGRSVSLAVDGSAVVLGDAHRLHQVVANLARNALVHTPEGTPVEVSVRHDHGSGGEADGVVLEVRDHGPGLPADAGDRLFERFWRDTAARGRGPAGAGLGLAIVAGVVAAHGGSVGAEDAPGGGAVFRVRLPAGSDAPARRGRERDAPRG